MENHPIPQDVTGFQFKLIGEMTVKQFAYLAFGIILAWIIFSLPLISLVKFPLVFLCGGFGAALAFLPIEGRPLDVMVGNFLKALITPTQYHYIKSGRPLFPTLPAHPHPVGPKKQAGNQQNTDNASDTKLQLYLSKLKTAPHNALDEKEMRFFNLFTNPASQVATPPPAQPSETTPSVNQSTSSVPQEKQLPQEQPQEKNQLLEQEAMLIKKELEDAKKEEASTTQTPTATMAHQKVVDLERQLQNILAEKEKLQNELISLQKQLTQQKQVFTPTVATPKVQTQNVRKIPLQMAKAAGLPMSPDVANLLAGIVKDARGNVLPNILVEVKDQSGNPARAFKTNGVGQFAAATPLPNGTYTIGFEDAKGEHKFDTVELVVNGTILQPLEIISVDQREELRKALFN